MDPNFKYKATLRTEEELHNIIDNREKYLPETVEASAKELQSRGYEFSDEEFRVIAEDMQARRDLANSDHDGFMMYTANAKDLQVEDPDALELYSKRAILVFSILFSVFFGSVMLGVNLSKAGHRDKGILAALCGFGFSVATILLGSQLKINSGLGIIAGWAGAYLLDLIFWKRFIGNSTLYRLKPIWWPLGIGIAVSVAILVLIFNYTGLKYK